MAYGTVEVLLSMKSWSVHCKEKVGGRTQAQHQPFLSGFDADRLRGSRAGRQRRNQKEGRDYQTLMLKLKDLRQRGQQQLGDLRVPEVPEGHKH